MSKHTVEVIKVLSRLDNHPRSKYCFDEILIKIDGVEVKVINFVYRIHNRSFQYGNRFKLPKRVTKHPEYKEIRKLLGIEIRRFWATGGYSKQLKEAEI